MLEKYKETKDTNSEETLKLYPEVRKISNQDISLVSVRYYSQNNLNLALETKNRVFEMKMDLENIPIPHMIHMHKKMWDIFCTDLLKATLKLSKLQTCKRKIENQLRQERVENKAHLQQIKKLQGDLLLVDSALNKGEETQKLLV